MDRDDRRLAKVLEELADLGRRIGERAGELARLSSAKSLNLFLAITPC